MNFLSIALLTLASTADSFTIGFHYGVKGVRIPGGSNFVISLICLAGTFVSMAAGACLGTAIPAGAAAWISAAALIGFGVYLLAKALIPAKRHPYISNPGAVDKDHSNVIEPGESVLAGILLSLNNVGMGICAGMAGVSFLLAPPLCAAASFLFIQSGAWLGRGVSCARLSRLLEILSAFLTIALGICSLC